MRKNIKCPNGHKYDKKKYRTCPHCSVDVNLDIIKGYEKTKNETMRNQPKDVHTILSSDDSIQEPIANINHDIHGWLVGISGHVASKDYRFNKTLTSFGIDFNGAFNHNINNHLLALNYFDLLTSADEMIIKKTSNEDIYVNNQIILGESFIKQGDEIRILDNCLIVQEFQGGKR